MSKSHCTSREDHQYTKKLLNVLSAVNVTARSVNTLQEEGAKGGDCKADKNRDDHGIREFRAHTEVKFHTNMLEAFKQGDHADHEAHEPHINGHVLLGTIESVFVIENQTLYRNEQGKRDSPR